MLKNSFSLLALFLVVSACGTIEREPVPLGNPFATQPTPLRTDNVIEIVASDARGTPLGSNRQRCDVAIFAEGFSEWRRIFGSYKTTDRLVLSEQEAEVLRDIVDSGGRPEAIVQISIPISYAQFETFLTYRLIPIADNRWGLEIRLPRRCREPLSRGRNDYDRFYRDGKWPYER